MRQRPRIWLYVFMIIVAAIILLPIFMLLVTALKSFDQVSQEHMWALPTSFSLQSFFEAWNGSGPQAPDALRNNFLNSVVMVIPATIFSCMLGSLNGYVFSKWRFPGSETLFTLVLFGMFIPYQAILVPLVQTLRTIGMYGSIPGLILTHVVYGLPITTLIFRNYYVSVPSELVDSGQVDGADFFSVYRYILFPLSAPGFVVVAIWQFTSIWNEFLFGLIITNDPRIRPVTVALQNISGSQYTRWNVQMAGALLVALPTLLVYIFLGRYFLRGLMAGALKG